MKQRRKVKLKKKKLMPFKKKKKLLGPDKIEKVIKVYGQKCNL